MLSINQGHGLKCHVCAEGISLWTRGVSTADVHTSLDTSAWWPSKALRRVSGQLRILLLKTVICLRRYGDWKNTTWRQGPSP